MTDFYTVLQTALSRVGAVDQGARERIYTHIREAMATKLRDLDPPLNEAQISARLDDFDIAIDRIERELVESQIAAQHEPPEPLPNGGARAAFAEPEELDETPAYDDRPNAPPDRGWSGDGRANGRADDAAGRGAADGYWDDAGAETPEDDEPERFDRPFFGDSGMGPSDQAEEPLDEPRTESDDRYRQAETEETDPGQANGHDRYVDGGWDSFDENGAHEARRSSAAADFGRPDWDSAPLGRRSEATVEESAEVEGTEPATTGWRQRLRAGGLFSRSKSKDRAEPEAPDFEEYQEPEPEPEPPRRRRGRKARRMEEDDGDPIAAIARNLSGGRRGRRAEPNLNTDPVRAASADHDVFSPDLDYDEAPAKRQSRRARKRAAAEARAAEREQLPPNRRRIWIVAILVIAIGIMGWAASVFIPILFPEGPAEEATAANAAPADPVAAANVPAADPAAPAPAAALPPQPALAPTEPIILFQGADPTVFEAGPENPVRYQGDANDGLARISSSISSGGARAVVGPGIVEAIAGRVVRIVLEARGAPGQAAATVNLSYQRGQSTLQVRQANLPAEFGPVAATWAIPAEGGVGGDYLLIDPGVPGDGTAIDIRSIRIEIIN